jgi:hypothetical protein
MWAAWLEDADMEEINITTKYYTGNPPVLSHQYSGTVVPTEYHCPVCGQKQVWVETDLGDYYVGESHYCAACGVEFHLPSTPQETNSSKQIVEQIRSHETQRSH